MRGVVTRTMRAKTTVCEGVKGERVHQYRRGKSINPDRSKDDKKGLGEASDEAAYKQAPSVRCKSCFDGQSHQIFVFFFFATKKKGGGGRWGRGLAEGPNTRIVGIARDENRVAR